jgi:hypothetical protein
VQEGPAHAVKRRSPGGRACCCVRSFSHPGTFAEVATRVRIPQRRRSLRELREELTLVGNAGRARGLSRSGRDDLDSVADVRIKGLVSPFTLE